MIRSLPARAALLLLVALSLVPRVALAFCGFYVGGADKKLFNNATIVVMMRDGTRTVLSMQNNYQGPPESFAMVVPVPVVLQKENVKTLPNEIFDRVDRAAAPRLVEYWEQDPCPPPHRYDQEERLAMAPMSEASPTDKAELGVKIEAKFAVGEYDVVILSADDALGLDTWLRRENYKIPEGAEPVLRPYVQGGMKFFVAKVDPKKVTFKGDQAMLSPLRFHYDSDTFSLPVRLGLINSAGTQDLIVHIFAHHQRYEVANYPNVTIPTNLDVAENARDEFGAFYAALFDRTLEENPKAVITEYAWPAGSCDPCPGPALSPQDLLTLGADVLPLPEGAHDDPEKPWMGMGARTGDLVLTRLHARYSKDALGEDLVLRGAAHHGRARSSKRKARARARRTTRDLQRFPRPLRHSPSLARPSHLSIAEARRLGWAAPGRARRHLAQSRAGPRLCAARHARARVLLALGRPRAPHHGRRRPRELCAPRLERDHPRGHAARHGRARDRLRALAPPSQSPRQQHGHRKIRQRGMILAF